MRTEYNILPRERIGSPRDTQVFRSLERMWVVWGKAFLVGAVVLLAWAWSTQLAPHTYTLKEMQAFSTITLNNFIHNQK